MLISVVIPFVLLAAHGHSVLEEKYGHVQKVETMRPKLSRDLVRNSADRSCRDFPLRIALVQDLTDSFSDDIEQMRTVQLPLIQKKLAETHPDSLLAVVTFRDKPISPLGVSASKHNGWYADYCAMINAKMTRLDSGDAPKLYASLSSNGGGDAPENAFGALLLAAQSKQIGWDTPHPDARNLVVVITDAPPHFEGDGDNTMSLPPFSGALNEQDPDAQCLREYYPSPLQVANVIRSLNAYVAFVIYDAEELKGLTGRSWLWMNRYLNQTDDFIKLQAKDSSNFWERLGKIIEEMEGIECESQTDGTSSSSSVPPATSSMGVDVSRAGVAAVSTSPAAQPERLDHRTSLTNTPCLNVEGPCAFSYRVEKDGVVVKSNSPVEDFQIIVNTEEIEWETDITLP